MPDPKPRWKFADKPLYGKGQVNRFELELGVSASEGTVTMREDDARSLDLNFQPYTLTIEDGSGNTLNIEDLFVMRTEPVIAQGSGEKVSRVSLRDKRWCFDEWPQFAGAFNVKMEGGDTFRSDTVKAGVPHTYDDLLQFVLDEMAIDVTAKTGVDLTVSLESDYAPAAAVLAKLLRLSSWDLALQPDGSFELIDLKDAGGAQGGGGGSNAGSSPGPGQGASKLPSSSRSRGSATAAVSKTAGGSTGFTPGGGLRRVAQDDTRSDLGARRPQFARVVFKILRSKEFTSWTPVLQADGKNAKGKDSSDQFTAGEWVKADTLLSHWGLGKANTLYSYYAYQARTENLAKIIVRLGGGNLGRTRWNHILKGYLRIYRLEDTDRAKILPLVKMQGAGVQVGREVFLGARAADCTHHIRRADAGGYTVNGANQPYFFQRSDTPPWPVRVVDPMEGIVEFVGQTPIAGVRILGNGGTVEQDFALEEPEKVAIIVGFIKKGSTKLNDKGKSVADADADRFIVERELPKPNNEKTKTFVTHDAFVREIFISGEFSALNTDVLKAEAEAFLEQYEETFQKRDAERHQFAGVDSDATMEAPIRSMLWEATEQGTSSTYRLHGPIQLIGPITARSREAQIILGAERAVILDAGAFGGGGGGRRFGSLDNHEAERKEHSSGDREIHAGLWERAPSFIRPHESGLLILSERLRPATDDDPCKDAPQVTKRGSGKTQTTKSQGGRPSGSTQTSGGPADQGNPSA